MSTGAEIQTPWNQTYYLTHDGYPNEVEPFINGLVEEARNKDEKFLTALQNKFNQLADSQDHMLNRDGAGGTQYKYVVDRDGDVTSSEVF